MRQSLIAFLVGLIFSVGLSISQMIDPAKVLGFLDVFGDWDASLALVMASALIVMALAWRIANNREAPVFAKRFPTLTRTDIDGRLITGSALFGIGWGLVGLCPGPALSGMALGRWEVYLFVLAMAVGMVLSRMLTSAKSPG